MAESRTDLLLRIVPDDVWNALLSEGANVIDGIAALRRVGLYCNLRDAANLLGEMSRMLGVEGPKLNKETP